jgi:hypothetical protein
MPSSIDDVKDDSEWPIFDFLHSFVKQRHFVLQIMQIIRTSKMINAKAPKIIAT